MFCFFPGKTLTYAIPLIDSLQKIEPKISVSRSKAKDIPLFCRLKIMSFSTLLVDLQHSIDCVPQYEYILESKFFY